MIYFKYNVSFKKVKNLSNLIETQKIERIDDEQNFNRSKKSLEFDAVQLTLNPFIKELA